MATHFYILAWEIAWTEGPIELQSMESQRVRHDLATKQSVYNESQYKMHFLLRKP